MKKNPLFLTIYAYILCTVPTQANNLSSCNKISPATEIQSGVFVRKGHSGNIFKEKNIANIGFIVGEKSIAVIDTGGSTDEGEALICMIRKVSKLPIRYVINTHVHPDHTLGNGAFTDSQTEFVGHQNLTHAMGILSKTYLRRYEEETGEKISDKAIKLPNIKVESTHDIDLGNRIITLSAIKKAHTNNDLTVYDHKTETLWLSDLLFHEHIPVIGKSGSINGWLKFIENTMNKNIKHIIPGHGPIPTKNNIGSFKAEEAYLTLVRDEIRKNIRENSDLTSAMNSIGLMESPKWEMFSTFHKRNISYIYSDLEWE